MSDGCLNFFPGEVGKLLGAKWKELDDEEKKPYVELANKDKARAEGEKTAYDGKGSSKKAVVAAASGSGEEDDDDE
jgi:hypothetical protein